MRVAVGVDKLGDLADDLGGLLDRDDPRLLVLALGRFYRFVPCIALRGRRAAVLKY